MWYMLLESRDQNITSQTPHRSKIHAMGIKSRPIRISNNSYYHLMFMMLQSISYRNLVLIKTCIIL
jgi:hypothetical protein